MRTFRLIEIDLPTHKALEAARLDFDETDADIIRRLLAGPGWSPTEREPEAWTDNGISLAHGTRLRMIYKKREHLAVIDNGMIRIGEKVFGNLSAAADAVTGVNLNGWQYWQAEVGGDWVKLDALRKAATQG